MCSTAPIMILKTVTKNSNCWMAGWQTTNVKRQQQTVRAQEKFVTQILCSRKYFYLVNVIYYLCLFEHLSTLTRFPPTPILLLAFDWLVPVYVVPSLPEWGFLHSQRIEWKSRSINRRSK